MIIAYKCSPSTRIAHRLCMDCIQEYAMKRSFVVAYRRSTNFIQALEAPMPQCYACGGQNHVFTNRYTLDIDYNKKIADNRVFPCNLDMTPTHPSSICREIFHTIGERESHTRGCPLFLRDRIMTTMNKTCSRLDKLIPFLRKTKYRTGDTIKIIEDVALCAMATDNKTKMQLYLSRWEELSLHDIIETLTDGIALMMRIGSAAEAFYCTCAHFYGSHIDCSQSDNSSGDHAGHPAFCGRIRGPTTLPAGLTDLMRTHFREYHQERLGEFFAVHQKALARANFDRLKFIEDAGFVMSQETSEGQRCYLGSTIIEKLKRHYRTRTMDDDSDMEIMHDIINTFRANKRAISTLFLCTTRNRHPQYLEWINNPSARRPTPPAPPADTNQPPLRNDEVSEEHLQSMDLDQLRDFMSQINSHVLVDDELHDRVLEQIHIMEVSLNSSSDRWDIDIDD